MPRNRNEAQFDEYRDWQWIKHLILRNYAHVWARIVGKGAREILAVDTCAGAGSYEDPYTRETFSEGSPVIFAKQAKAYTEEFGPGRTMKVIACEKNGNNYAKLVENLRVYAPYITTLRGGFEGHVPRIVEQLGTAPALILLDPIGLASIPAPTWRPFLDRVAKTDMFFVLHFTGVHRVGGWLLPDGTPKSSIAGARQGAANMDKVFNSTDWRTIATDPALQGEGPDKRRARERRYVQLFYEEVIGDRHQWKGYIEVRAHYSAPVKYWLVHACNDEKPYEVMNDQVVRVSETLLNRENSEPGQIGGFAEVSLEAHRATIQRQLEEAIVRRIQSATGAGLPFGALRQQLAKSGFFGRVRWVGGYSEAIRTLCEQAKLQRENERLKAKFLEGEIIRAAESNPEPDSGAPVLPIRGVA